jgi:hypothetical protein
MARTSEKMRDCIGIILVGVFVSPLLPPFQNAPVDDFTFAWSVEDLQQWNH